METNPIILDSTPLPKNREVFAVIIYARQPKNELKGNIPSKLHSIWDNLKDAESSAIRCIEANHPYVECALVNTNSEPHSILPTEENKYWLNWEVKSCFLPTSIKASSSQNEQ